MQRLTAVFIAMFRRTEDAAHCLSHAALIVASATFSFTEIINQGDFQNQIQTRTRLKTSLPPQPTLNPTVKTQS